MARSRGAVDLPPGYKTEAAQNTPIPQPLLTSPHWPHEWIAEEFRYTEVHHATFRKQGFIQFDRFLTHEALTFLRREVDCVLSQLHSSIHSEWVMSLHQLLPHTNNWLWRLATQPMLLDMLSFHYGERVTLFSSQLAVKAQQGGTETPWHQDGERCRTVWIPLDDVNDSNGTLVVKPGWHRRGRLPMRKLKETDEDVEDVLFFAKHHLYEVNPGISRRRFEHDAVSIKLPAGGLEMHHPQSPHCSHANRVMPLVVSLS
eukprot:m.208482 g.208482  ORF g.208482 m.208482 type:complete len:258 (+) comp15042_c0_seq11:85-858(+)